MKTTGLLRQTLLACVVATLLGTVAEAQPGGGRGGRGGRGGGGGGPQMTISRAQLLGSEDVQAELKIDDGQAATLTAALEAYREERNAARPDFRAMRELSEEDRTKAVEKMQKDAEALNKKTDEVLQALMEPEQFKRLDQIATQVRMRFAATGTLKAKEMRAALSITDEQLVKVEDVETAASEARRKKFEEMRTGGGGGGGAGGDFRAMFEKSQQETNDKIMAILTDEQRKKLDEMKGQEFEVDMQSLMRGGRGGGGDRNRGGAGGRNGEGGRGGDGGGRGDRRRPAQDNSDDAV